MLRTGGSAWQGLDMSVSSQLPALVGVAVGGVLSWGFASLTDRARFRREFRVRWHERRLMEYAAFSSATKRTMSILFRVAAGALLDDQTEQIPLEDARPLLANAFHEREEAFERVRLVGSPAVITAARAWVQEIYVMRSLVEKSATTREVWQAQVAVTNKRRDEFYAAARQEVGLVGTQ